MGRILYLLLSSPRLSGGQKMTIRHGEALRELGFDAHCILGAGGAPPVGLQHRAPILTGVATRPDDVLVLPEDAPNAMRQFVGRPERVVIFAQGLYGLAGLGLEAYDAYPPDARPPSASWRPRPSSSPGSPAIAANGSSSTAASALPVMSSCGT